MQNKSRAKAMPWWVFRGGRDASDDSTRPILPDAPPWRPFGHTPVPEIDTEVAPMEVSFYRRGIGYIADDDEIEMVNMALYLRRPLLITGKPGTGKSTLAYAVAEELELKDPLVWRITTRSTVPHGLYRYDAVGRLHALAIQNERLVRQARLSKTSGSNTKASGDDSTTDEKIGNFLRLGPLGTALATSLKNQPRVLLIDEIDKSDIDLPNDLLHVFEEGMFPIPELERLGENFRAWIAPDDDGPSIEIAGGHVHCKEFPLVMMTSNGERDFPPAFLRRCLRLKIDQPDETKLERIVALHLAQDPAVLQSAKTLITEFFNRRESGSDLATDQLLNAVYLALRQTDKKNRGKVELKKVLGASLDKVLQPLKMENDE